MNTNFFKNFAEIAKAGRYRLGIEVINGTIAANISPINDKDEPLVDGIPPLCFPFVSPEKLDEAFFDDIAQTLQSVAEFASNKEQVENALKAAKEKQSSVSTKSTTAKTEKPASPKFTKAMSTVAQLQAAGKYGQALAQLPKIIEFPEFKVQIEAKEKELRKLRGLDADLFSDTGDVVAGSTPGTNDTGGAAASSGEDDNDEDADNADEPYEESGDYDDDFPNTATSYSIEDNLIDAPED